MPTDTSLRLAAELGSTNATWAVLTSADAVAYATAHPVPIEAGASPFAGGPDLALVDSEGRTALVVPNIEAPQAAEALADAVFDYSGFDIEVATDVHASYQAAVEAALEWLSPRGPAAIDPVTLPLTVESLVRHHTPTTIDGRRVLDRARKVKTERERQLLRESARMAALAQRTATSTATEGMAELDLFTAIRGAVEANSGARDAFIADLVTGVDRTSHVSGGPTPRRLEAGDPVIADLAPRVQGYWADSCNTFTVGAASDGLRRLHDLVTRALAAAVESAGPGVPVGEVDATVRRILAAQDLGYPHHTGHSIGTSVHEWPRIIPGETEPLEEGMVILLEPGAYATGVGGVRLERMYAVGPNGLEVLTDFPQQLEQEP